MLAVALKLPQPPLPAGAEQTSVALVMVLASPLLALALALISAYLKGSWLSRAMLLSGFCFVIYTLNTVLEASVFVQGYDVTSYFTLLSGAVASLLCGAAAAFLFPPQKKGESLLAGWKLFAAQRPARAWAWRVPLAAVFYMPVYITFGLMVNPITSEYYRQNMYGLKAAGWEQILPVLFGRSLLLLVVCAAVMAAWQGTSRRLFVHLGTSVFLLSGFIYLLIGYWMPVLTVRLPHALELLADAVVCVAGYLFLLEEKSISGLGKGAKQVL
jgi:hypothetical protein